MKKYSLIRSLNNVGSLGALAEVIEEKETRLGDFIFAYSPNWFGSCVQNECIPAAGLLIFSCLK